MFPVPQTGEPGPGGPVPDLLTPLERHARRKQPHLAAGHGWPQRMNPAATPAAPEKTP
uniref:Vegetative cell wall protein gp1-like n=1 Tax=mine drainage metagenome TaxID=410659 RepID=E6PUS6_9ZZZZ